MENDKIQAQATMFQNRMAKRYPYYQKWARRQNLTAYRVYDRDIPEIPLCVDVYGFVDEAGGIVDRYACLAMFERPYARDPSEEAQWLDVMKGIVAKVLDLSLDHVLMKTRKRQKGSDQYEKTRAVRTISGVVCEGELRFSVNLTDYLDTGLFLDHRPLRKVILSSARGKRVLNLFGYTGSLSVAAAKGGATYVQTVDLSNTYLDWAGVNLSLNGLDDNARFPRTRFDVVSFLDLEARKRRSGTKEGFDLILLDPPTFSNSKMTDSVLDTNRQWPQLVCGCLALLNAGGVLYFSTNSRRLRFEPAQLPRDVDGDRLVVTEITAATIPEDFKGHRIHRCWKIVRTKDAT